MSLELQVQQNTQAINQILKQAKNLKELPVYEDELSEGDLIMIYINAIDQTISIEYSRFLELVASENIDLTDYLRLGGYTGTAQELKDDIDGNEIRIGQLEGLGLFADMPNQKILIRNSEGTLISELSVGWLNNEGTTFFYNETTEELELSNDQGEVLSSIPVSAFVSNLAATISISGNRLTLRDSSNNSLSFVDLEISNIGGLQAALDGKEDVDNKVQTITGNENSDKYPSVPAIEGRYYKKTGGVVSGEVIIENSSFGNLLNIKRLGGLQNAAIGFDSEHPDKTKQFIGFDTAADLFAVTKGALPLYSAPFRVNTETGRAVIGAAVNSDEAVRLSQLNSAANSAEQNAKDYAKNLSKEVKEIINTTQYTVVAEDVDKVLDFTANAGEEIDLIINTGVIPANKSIQFISSGNNIVIPVGGSGVTLAQTEGSKLKSRGKGSFVEILSTTVAETFAVTGDLENDIVQSDWTEQDTSSPAYIKNKDYVLVDQSKYTMKLDTIQELKDYQGGSVNIIVEDSLRGGFFTYTETRLQQDGGIIFDSAKGGSWRRQINQSVGVNVQWYGVTGDGVTNDQPAFQMAVDAIGANANGGLLFAPAGEYLFSGDGVKWKDKVVLRGAGIGKTVFTVDGEFDGVFYNIDYSGDGSDGGNPAAWLKNVGFFDFTVDGAGYTNTVPSPNSKGIFVLYIKDSIFQNLEIKNTIGTGLGMDFFDNVTMFNITARNCGRLYGQAGGSDAGQSGIGIGTGSLSHEPFIVSNCFAYDCGNFGIFVEDQGSSISSGGGVITNCKASGNSIGFGNIQRSLPSNSYSPVKFIDCESFNNDVGFRNYRGYSVIDNATIRDNATYGIQINFESKVKITGKSEIANNDRGIYSAIASTVELEISDTSINGNVLGAYMYNVEKLILNNVIFKSNTNTLEFAAKGLLPLAILENVKVFNSNSGFTFIQRLENDPLVDLFMNNNYVDATTPISGLENVNVVQIKGNYGIADSQ